MQLVCNTRVFKIDDLVQAHGEWPLLWFFERHEAEFFGGPLFRVAILSHLPGGVFEAPAKV